MCAYVCVSASVRVRVRVRACGVGLCVRWVSGVRYVVCFFCFLFFFFMHFFSDTKHPREDNPNLYYWAEMTGLHTQTLNI